MVLGFILYESIDLVVNVGKLGYNTVSGVYKWYYTIESPEVEERKKEIDKIEKLEEKIDQLSKMFQENDLKEVLFLKKREQKEENIKIKD